MAARLNAPSPQSQPSPLAVENESLRAGLKALSSKSQLLVVENESHPLAQSLLAVEHESLTLTLKDLRSKSQLLVVENESLCAKSQLLAVENESLRSQLAERAEAISHLEAQRTLALTLAL